MGTQGVRVMNPHPHPLASGSHGSNVRPLCSIPPHQPHPRSPQNPRGQCPAMQDKIFKVLVLEGKNRFCSFRRWLLSLWHGMVIFKQYPGHTHNRYGEVNYDLYHDYLFNRGGEDVRTIVPSDPKEPVSTSGDGKDGHGQSLSSPLHPSPGLPDPKNIRGRENHPAIGALPSITWVCRRLVGDSML